MSSSRRIFIHFGRSSARTWFSRRLTVNLIVGAAILSIALNPIVFLLIPRFTLQLTSRWGWAREAALREAPFEKRDDDTPTDQLRHQIVLTGDSSLLVPLSTQLYREKQAIVVKR